MEGKINKFLLVIYEIMDEVNGYPNFIQEIPGRHIDRSEAIFDFAEPAEKIILDVNKLLNEEDMEDSQEETPTYTEDEIWKSLSVN